MGADFSGWLDQVLPSTPLLCAKRLSYGDISKDDDFPGSIHLPRALWQALAPGSLVGADVSPRPVALCDPFGVRSTGTLGWNQTTSLTNASHELRLGVSEDPVSLLRDPENVGAIAIFVFSRLQGRIECAYFVCGAIDDEEDAEERLGPVEPGYATVQGVRVPRMPGYSGLPEALPTEIPARNW